MIKIIKDPLFYFLIFGFLLFEYYSLINPDENSDNNIDNKIVISLDKQKSLINNFESIKQRKPTNAEFNGIIESYIREEIYYREGMKLGLNLNDNIIRRRIATKMEFLTHSNNQIKESSVDEMENFYNLNKNKYNLPAVFTFQQVNLDFIKSKLYASETDLNNLIKQIKTNQVDPKTLITSSILDYEFTNIDEIKILKMFGDKFLQQLISAPKNVWHGPVNTDLGLFVIKLIRHDIGSYPSFHRIKKEVEVDLNEFKKEKQMEQQFEELNSKYKVVITNRLEFEASTGTLGSVLQ